MYFRNYELQKTWLEKCLKNPVWEDLSRRNIGNVPKSCCNHDDRSFTIFIDHCEHHSVEKKSVLVLCKILRLFLNTLTADDKYSLHNRDNLTQPIHILLPKKQKTFFQFFSSWLKSILNFKHCEKKNDPHSRCISEITHSGKGD